MPYIYARELILRSFLFLVCYLEFQVKGPFHSIFLSWKAKFLTSNIDLNPT